MGTILLTSGYPEAVIQAVRKKWNVVNIPSQEKAVAYLKSCAHMPDAASVGRVQDGRALPGDFDARRMLQEIHKLDPQMPVVISTHESSPRQIVDLIKQGAFDYVIEPAGLAGGQGLEGYVQDFLFALTRAVAWRELARENQRLKEDLVARSRPEFILGRSAGTRQVIELIRKVAPTPATVLITGESGTGKELVARAIHDQSAHRDQPFIPVNCGAVSDSLLAGELFGHVRGAFTGAELDRPGLIAEAGAGTLFLDEISAVSPSFQVMLLRVLEDRRVRPVGGTGSREVKCRFLAAANRDLGDLVRQNKFREDLFYRLNVFHIAIPPLRDRREDIPILSNFFLQEAARQFGKPVTGISNEAMEVLERFAWPGNVRQLRNAIERAVIICDGQTLTAADLDPGLTITPANEGLRYPHAGYEQAMREFEWNLIRTALDRAGGNHARAARDLKMNRTTFNYRLHVLECRNRDEQE